MADEKLDKKVKNSTHIAPEVEIVETPKKVHVNKRHKRGLIIGLIVGGVVVFVMIGMVTYAIANRLYGRHVAPGDRFGTSSTQITHFGRGGMGMGYGSRIETQVGSGTVTTTVYTYLTGVVTAVGNDSITVAGHGKTTIIKTSSSTSYAGDIKPSVNDTVTIAGTTDNDGIIATEVSVEN
jgi:Domain of unknown function (DUF5666)